MPHLDKNYIFIEKFDDTPYIFTNGQQRRGTIELWKAKDGSKVWKALDDWDDLANQAGHLGTLDEIAEIQIMRKTNKEQRLKDLGMDLDTKRNRIHEASAAFEIEEEWGYFRRYKSNDPNRKGDWIGLSRKGEGKLFDELGGSIPDNKRLVGEITRKAKKRAQFFESIDEHFIKADYVILNFTNLKKHDINLYNEAMMYIKQHYGTSKLIDLTDKL